MKFVLALALVTFSQGVLAQELSSVSLLSKLSMSIRGINPSKSEVEDLKRVENTSAKSEFFDKKIDEYLKSPGHVHKMNYRLNELFQIIDSLSTWPAKYNNRNSLNDLFMRMASENLSWDELLIGKSYNAYSPIDNASADVALSDFSYFGDLIDLPSTDVGAAKDLESGSDETAEPVKIKFDENDPRIAGALTTRRFVSRYVTTAINKNRRRAAAIFRIFLCDPMQAAIPILNRDTKQKILDLMYPEVTFSELELKAVITGNDSLHGSRADCQACHYKLDPMGKTFLLSPSSLSKYASPGRLTFKNSKGVLVDIPVSGIGELGLAITKQDDYASCQVKQFWTWFIGQDVSLSPQVQAELTTEFNREGRKTNDFIKYLVLRPEFSVKYTSSEGVNLALQVKSYLKRCDSCHSGTSSYNFDTGGVIPSLTAWPNLGADVKFGDNKFWINKIGEKLNLDKNLGKYREMPPGPEDGGWIPSRRELELVKRWIDVGAPDETGKRMIQ